jgi:hypothetical protein
MSTIVIDAGLREKLLAAGKRVELRDEAGNLVGQFVPAGEIIPEFASISYAEMERRANSDGPKYTTAQVMEYLRKLA